MSASHVLSEDGSGARTSNEWAAVLTADAFPEEFYQGDQTGSLNWWLRTLTGFLFGLGSILFLFTWLDDYFRGVRQKLEMQNESRIRMLTIGNPPYQTAD